MGLSGFSQSYAGQVRGMIFIDGGYLRKNVSELFDEEINYQNLANFLKSKISERGLLTQVVRVYYYDAQYVNIELSDNLSVEENRAWHKIENELIPKQEKYLDNIRQIDLFDVKLGKLIRTENGKFRQKGVDTLLAIDMLTKAYQLQYDEAILLAGDSDFIELVEAVKNIGPRVTGVYFEKNVRKEFAYVFDKRFPLTKQILLDKKIIVQKK